MSCPTCDGTMQGLGVLEGRVYHWCPRCGTLRVRCGFDGDGEPIHSDDRPKLIDRCRTFEGRMVSGRPEGGRVGRSDWLGLGIAESINLPDSRPTTAAK